MKRLLPLLLTLALLLAACGPKTLAPTPSEEPSAGPSPSAAPDPARASVELALLPGPTGIAAAKLMADSADGATNNYYNITLVADSGEVTAGLVDGSFHIAALPTNVAAQLYHETDGAIRLLCVAALEETPAEGVEVDNSPLAWGLGGWATQGLVARADFVDAYPGAVNAFLNEYAASLDFVRANGDGPAAQLVVDGGLAASVEEAAGAIAGCDLVFLTGEDMRDAVQDYFTNLFLVDPAAIGGSTPDDAFYFMDAVVE